MYLTGNLQDLFESSAEQSTFLSKQQITNLSETNLDNVISWRWSIKCYRPRVHIRYNDDQLGIQPVAGVRITVGRGYWWYDRYTNEHGQAVGETRCSSVKYKLHWDDDNFVLQDKGWEYDGGVGW